MAPIKFEDKLKDKLENRSLQPSEDAWNTLANRLDEDDKKHNSKRFWWLGIAASIIGVILITTQFYKSTDATKELPIVVDTNTNTQNESELIPVPSTNDHTLINSEENKEDLELLNTTEVASANKNSTRQDQTSAKKEKVIFKSQEPQNNLASSEISIPETNNNVPVKTLSQEELKIIEIVDVIKQLQASDSSVSDREIDSLLKQAQREILKQNIFNETTRTVNADALLQDVEVELEQSFRDKVFDALKSSYNSVKTAVAERHN